LVCKPWIGDHGTLRIGGVKIPFIISHLDMMWNTTVEVMGVLETTWNQERNETFKVHEMEQLY
jgi:hypothetical protein